MEEPNKVNSLVITVEHFPGTVKTKAAWITVTNHKTGETQVIECKNNTEAMRIVASNVIQQDMAMLAAKTAATAVEDPDEKWFNSAMGGNA